MPSSSRPFPRPYRAIAAGACITIALSAARAQVAANASALPADSVLARALVFRSIGPALMGGRIADIAVAENPKSVRGGGLGTVIYIAAASGGVFKSTK